MKVLKGISWKPFIDTTKQGWFNLSVMYVDEYVGEKAHGKEESIDFMVHESVIRDILPKLSKTLEQLETLKKGGEIKFDKKDAKKMVDETSVSSDNSMFG